MVADRMLQGAEGGHEDHPKEVRSGVQTMSRVEGNAAPFKMNEAMAKFLSSTPISHAGIFIEEPPPAIPCPHKEWAEDGEQYRCRLQAGHKGKCQPGERLS